MSGLKGQARKANDVGVVNALARPRRPAPRVGACAPRPCCRPFGTLVWEGDAYPGSPHLGRSDPGLYAVVPLGLRVNMQQHARSHLDHGLTHGGHQGAQHINVAAPDVNDDDGDRYAGEALLVLQVAVNREQDIELLGGKPSLTSRGLAFPA